MEVGQLQLIGTLDTTDIERGQRRIEVGFDNVEQRTRGTTGSMSGLARVSSSLLTTFVGLGTVGVGALTALGLRSPQVAGSMASIRNSTRQLSFAMGDELAPVMERVAGLYEDFVMSVSTEGTFLNRGIGLLAGIFDEVIGRVENTKRLFEDLSNNRFFKWLSSEKENEDGTTQPSISQALIEGEGQGSPLIQAGVTGAAGLIASRLFSSPLLGKLGAGLGGIQALDTLSFSENELLRTLALSTGFGAATGAGLGGVGALPGAVIGAGGGLVYYGGKQAVNSIRQSFFTNDTVGGNFE